MFFFQLLIPSDAKQSPVRLLLTLGLPMALLLSFVGLQLLDFDQLGWREGFSHPLVGWDHVVTMLAVGIWAAQLRGRAIWLLPLAFVSVMSLGGLAGSLGVSIPSVEGLILLSCAVFSVLITRRVRFSSKINVMIVAFFGFFHGFAHGHEISTSASLVSYTLGFMLATLLLHGTGILVAKLVVVAVGCLFSLMLSNIAIAAASAETQQDDSRQIGFIDSGFSAGNAQQNDYFSLAQDNCVQSSAKAGDSRLADRQQQRETGRQSPPPQPPLATWPSVCWPQALVIGCLSFKHFFPDINQTPGTQLSSNGVGLTSPPLAISPALAPCPVLNSDSVSQSKLEAQTLQNLSAKPAFGDITPIIRSTANTDALRLPALPCLFAGATPYPLAFAEFHRCTTSLDPHIPGRMPSVCSRYFFTTTTTTQPRGTRGYYTRARTYSVHDLVIAIPAGIADRHRAGRVFGLHLRPAGAGMAG